MHSASRVFLKLNYFLFLEGNPILNANAMDI